MPNVWGNVAGVTSALPMVTLLGLTGQLMGMNAAATAVEYKAITFLNSQLGNVIGAVGAPSYTFSGDLTTGVYQNGAGKLALAALGVQAIQFDGTTTIATIGHHLRFNGKILQEAMSANIVAAANIDLGTATGNYVYITSAAGVIAITRLGGNISLPAGTEIEAKFVITGGTVTLKNDVNFLNLPGGSDLSIFTGDVVRFRKTNSFDQFWDMVSYSRNAAIQVTASAPQPVTFIQPDINDRPSMVAGGWLPWNLNNQWGGAGCMPRHEVDAATSVEYKFDIFDGYIEDDSSGDAIGNAAGSFYLYQGITPAKNLSLQAIWCKVYKVLNPVDNLTLKLWSVAAGVPNVLVATANVINGKQITSDTNGQWYRFSFAAVQALVAGTQYVFTMEKSAGVDAANFYGFKRKVTTKYPNNLGGVGTAVPAWTATNANSRIFMCEAQASDQVVQSAGTFNGRIIGNEGNPINRSTGYIKPLREFFPLFRADGWSIVLRGKSWTKDKTVADLMYGLHHDRINIRAAIASGFTTVTVYKSDGTIVTVTGTTDLSTATFKDVMIVGRSMGDGADYIKIYVGAANIWALEASATAQTLTFDPLMRLQGHMWIMGGFQLFSSATYTKLSDMTILPSADGWTFTTTTATVEGNVFAVAGNKLNQIKAGMAAGGDGYYNRAWAANNATGWLVASKVRIPSGTNTKDQYGSFLQLLDGTKNASLYLQEYYFSNVIGTTVYPQIDLKSADTTVWISAKGSDALVFMNGKLVADNIATNTTAVATNAINFGDASATANENADAVWDYVGYYTTSNIYPQFTSGELHEFAVFAGDQNVLGQALYGAGSPVSIKTYCGIGRNFVGEAVLQEISQGGVTATPTTVSTTLVLQAEMESFVIGNNISVEHFSDLVNNTNGAATWVAPFIDGAAVHQGYASQGLGTSTVTGGSIDGMGYVSRKGIKTNFGLHKLEGRWQVSGTTGSSNGTRRTMNASAGVK